MVMYKNSVGYQMLLKLFIKFIDNIIKLMNTHGASTYTYTVCA